MKKLRILCDLDEIVVCLKKTSWLPLYNKDYNDNLTLADITDWDIEKIVKPECGEKIFDYVLKDEFYYNLKPVEGAIEAVKYLNSKYKLMIVTAGSANPSSAAEKFRWVRDHLGFKRQQVMIAQNKHWIQGDVLIDDSPHQIQNYRKAWPDSNILTIDYPYNAHVADLVDVRAESFNDRTKAWEQIVKYIDKLEQLRMSIFDK